ncbi:MAG: hypothetical protein J7578_18560 [Chitinophagaceae bacterium]|nr:hypothetical protein [Chitinophagaceae bacterium]
MKKLMAVVLFLCASLTLTHCSDKGGDGPAPPNPCSETALAVTTTPAVNSSDKVQVEADLPVTINITAGFPAGGATLDITAKNEANNVQFFANSSSLTTSGVHNITITQTPPNSTAIVQITVTSKNCASNKWTGTFRYKRK